MNANDLGPAQQLARVFKEKLQWEEVCVIYNSDTMWSKSVFKTFREEWMTLHNGKPRGLTVFDAKTGDEYGLLDIMILVDQSPCKAILSLQLSIQDQKWTLKYGIM